MTTALLPEAWSALGGAEDHLASVTMQGSTDGLLASRVMAFDAMAAAIATALLAAAELHEARTGGSPGPPTSPGRRRTRAPCQPRSSIMPPAIWPQPPPGAL